MYIIQCIRRARQVIARVAEDMWNSRNRYKRITQRIARSRTSLKNLSVYILYIHPHSSAWYRISNGIITEVFSLSIWIPDLIAVLFGRSRVYLASRHGNCHCRYTSGISIEEIRHLCWVGFIHFPFFLLLIYPRADVCSRLTSLHKDTVKVYTSG